MLHHLYGADARANAKAQKLRFFPLAIVGGAGSYVIADDGRRLLDFSAAWGAASLGYGHPAYVEAVARAARNPAGASILSAANRPAIELAERLLATVPGQAERKVWIGHSGSDANDAVARVVRAATGRQQMIAFVGSYHGGVGASMAISGHIAQRHVAKASGLILIPYPDPYRLPHNDRAGDSIVAQLEEAATSSGGLDNVAALFFEPIQADGGMLVPPDGFFRKLADFCARHGILTVCDEVKVGLGRTGALNCFEHEGITPDIVTLGKGLGGGLPVSAAIGPAPVMDVAAAFAMQTLHGNPICASAALAVLETIDRESLVENAAEVGAHLQGRLRALSERHNLIGEVRGRGLAIGIELVADRASKTPASRQTAKVVYRCFELGLVLYYVGMSGSVLELTPPLTLSREEADAAVEILDKALADVEEGRVPDHILEGFEGW
jgi:4-aminobutyrate aminotransferase